MNQYYQVHSCIGCKNTLVNSIWNDYNVAECKKCEGYKVYYKILNNGDTDINTVKIFANDNLYVCITQKVTQFISYKNKSYDPINGLNLHLDNDCNEVCVDHPIKIDMLNVAEQYQSAKNKLT